MSSNFEASRETLKERADVLLTSGNLSDCEFVVGDSEEKIRAHKLFMAISSPVFFAMFFGDMAEKSDRIRINDIDSSAFKGMLQYIYTDRVDFESCGHACMVHLAAKKYLLPYLEAQCEQYIETTVDATTACEIYEFAKFHSIASIEDVCLSLFKTETSSVLTSAGFSDADLTTVRTIVDQDDLNINSELELFKAVEDWAKKEAERQGTTLEAIALEIKDVVLQLRFLSMKAEEFASGPGLSPLLSTEEQLALVMNITTPGVRSLPKNFCTLTTPRRPLPTPVALEMEWSLLRQCEEGALFPVTKWCNPFTRKGITVSRRINLSGVKINSQKKTAMSWDDVYQEKVTLVLKKDWALKFSAAIYQNTTQYNSEIQINFPKPVLLEPGKLYWLIVQFDKGGTYSFLKDLNCNYSSHGMEVKFSEDFSTITEVLFADNDMSLQLMKGD